MASELWVAAKGGAARFRVRVKPRVARSRIGGVREGVLDVSVAAPPVDGEANAELIRVLSRKLGIKRRAVRVVSGEASRSKLIEVDGLDAEAVAVGLLE